VNAITPVMLLWPGNAAARPEAAATAAALAACGLAGTAGPPPWLPGPDFFEQIQFLGCAPRIEDLAALRPFRVWLAAPGEGPVARGQTADGWRVVIAGVHEAEAVPGAGLLAALAAAWGCEAVFGYAAARS
jgi:hypothetical protein